MDELTIFETRLGKLRERRGYLLPHHGLLAIASESLIEAYDHAYNAFALTPGQTSRYDHEALWLAILTANEQPVATHHIARFREQGGTAADIEALLALTAITCGFRCWSFVGHHWQAHLPDIDPREAWLASFRRVAEPLPLRLAHLVAIAVLVCRDAWEGLAWQLVAARRDGVPEIEIAETLALIMLPGGVPRLVDAATVWRRLILAGEIDASAAYRHWAEVVGQGGYDEASGLAAQCQSPSTDSSS
jgi:alkylhydroperoxidase/carboxymuconolactone decarboxylase family protein YurZ